MKGLIVNHLGREVKAGAPGGQVMAIAHLMHDNMFHLQVGVSDGDAFIHSYQIVKEGMGAEIVTAEFDEASVPITEENQKETCQIDPECSRIFDEWTSEEFQQKRKLERFRKLEVILKNEGLI